MEAGVILRNQRLKPVTDCWSVCGKMTAKDGEISPLPEFSHETLTEAQQAAEAWIAAWCQRSNPAESPLPSVAFGLSCALAELDDTLPQTLNTRKAPLCTGDRMI